MVAVELPAAAAVATTAVAAPAARVAAAMSISLHVDGLNGGGFAFFFPLVIIF